MVRIALPNKGRVYEPIMSLFEGAGLHVIEHSQRSLFAKTVDENITMLFARSRDIPGYVENGAADLGITGEDFIQEAGADVEVLLDLGMGKAELVLAVPEASAIERPEQLAGKKVATEFPEITKKYFATRGISVHVVEVCGATEITPHIGVADAIVDLTSTGTSLSMNRLKIIGRVLRTSQRLIASKASLAQDGRKISEITLALQSVIEARGKRYLMMNVPEGALEAVKKKLPGLAGPTVLKVEADSPMCAVHAVVPENEIYRVINDLKEVGARDILIVPIERIVR
ncbi:ATP phosphoribosyltransferase [Methanocella arvoryzae]|uniref:ATP phosphoribosyltransferase n=1 Tax=Methanocella arvoryzae (strain DSM 22066 / NBRC 105507 / MRE50) TaxID=351160 RepID=HIS1_METAR|nr:ATP phosphoribosyltransferase [Methanocella arvoryzae]Q0W6K3.1 RecName: Full=ATP phosphoribosyltransferase; Short=ATP-PRT; Short=ATP-PRTase [Methanocella arvoryzae MRE50]CAJ35990.1 ATP phosphoribosyltransferase [Methanocella arvoryzae MRE50]